jgi:HSP20 family protein
MSRKDLNDWFWHVSAEFTGLVVEPGARQVSVAANKFWQPRVDVLEDSYVLLIKAELAGVKIDDIHLVYVADEHMIQLRGVRHEENPSEMTRIGIHQLEVFYGEFERDIALPRHARIDPERIQASFRNGFLMVLVPKVDCMPQNTI